LWKSKKAKMELVKKVNGIDVFKGKTYGKVTFTLKKGWCTIGNFYTLKEAIKFAQKS